MSSASANETSSTTNTNNHNNESTTNANTNNTSNNASKKPANTAFKQQRLPAWQPILTPRNVWPSFILIGVTFLALGVGFYITAQNVKEKILDYTYCDQGGEPPSPITQWSWDATNDQCTVQFNIDTTWTGPVFLYYRLTNFYQNHRRYVKSRSISQLQGQNTPVSSLTTDCDPLTTDASGKIIYPCGLIANSWFNDQLGFPTGVIQNVDTTQPSLKFTSDQIAWPADLTRYGNTQYPPSQISPPPDWKFFYDKSGNKIVVNPSTGWTAAQLAAFDISNNQHFMVWMRTAGLPTFRKLYGRQNGNMAPGTYSIIITSTFAVTSFSGTKAIVLSTVSWLGGKNNFLGVAYITVGVICLVLGLAFMARHLIKPRKLGDHTYLSWNQPEITERPEQEALLNANSQVRGTPANDISGVAKNNRNPVVEGFAVPQ